MLPDFDGYTGDNPNYLRVISQAYLFFRRHAEGRYSDRTLMRLIRAKEAAEQGSLYGLPVLLTAQTTVEFDELTEQKKGGVTGLAVLWPNEDGRTILAVHRQLRQKYIGWTLLNLVPAWCSGGSAHLWVGRHNTVGHQFLLSAGYYPVMMSAQGAVKYAMTTESDDDEGGEMAYRDVPAMPARSDPVPRRERTQAEDVLMSIRELDLLRETNTGGLIQNATWVSSTA